MVKQKHAVDVYVGSRIRLRRMNIGCTMMNLADALGITYQQLNKYENATNRVSASRLHEIAKELKIDISFFFPK